jgi:creatinine amidohydrolase/Fe(II)-dependent formamide hydrolase-like protein
VIYAQSVAGTRIRRLAELSVADIRALDRAKTVVMIPGGPFEEHGPYLPAFTDGYVSESAAFEVAKGITVKPGWRVVMFPVIPLGVGSPEDFGGRRPFSGSYTVRPATLRAVLMDLASALGDDGFRWIFIVNGHGSPSHNRALIEASDYFREVYGGTMVPLSAYRYAAVERRPSLWSDEASRENAGDVHGGADETSRILFLRPGLVHGGYRSAVPQTAPSDNDLPPLAAAPDWPGYFGSPRLANAKNGAAIVQRLTEDLTALALRVLDGFDPHDLPNRGNPGDGAFKVLDDNLLKRSVALAERESDWLRRRNLK